MFDFSYLITFSIRHMTPNNISPKKKKQKGKRTLASTTTIYIIYKTHVANASGSSTSLYSKSFLPHHHTITLYNKSTFTAPPSSLSPFYSKLLCYELQRNKTSDLSFHFVIIQNPSGKFFCGQFNFTALAASIAFFIFIFYLKHLFSFQ